MNILITAMLPQEYRIKICCDADMLPRIKQIAGVTRVTQNALFTNQYIVHLSGAAHIDDVRARLEGLNREHA